MSNIATPSLQQLSDVQADMAEVRSGMMKVFRDIKDGNTNRKDADAIANAAGKVIGAAKTELASIALAKAIRDNTRIINPPAEQDVTPALPAGMPGETEDAPA